MPSMKRIEFSKEQKQSIVDKLKKYFDAELNQDIGQFEAEFLIDFISDTLGGYYYNQGLLDARVAIRSKLDDLESEIESLEMPVETGK